MPTARGSRLGWQIERPVPNELEGAVMQRYCFGVAIALLFNLISFDANAQGSLDGLESAPLTLQQERAAANVRADSPVIFSNASATIVDVNGVRKPIGHWTQADFRAFSRRYHAKLHERDETFLPIGELMLLDMFEWMTEDSGGGGGE